MSKKQKRRGGKKAKRSTRNDPSRVRYHSTNRRSRNKVRRILKHNGLAAATVYALAHGVEIPAAVV